jgi:hypothetical protein
MPSVDRMLYKLIPRRLCAAVFGFNGDASSRANDYIIRVKISHGHFLCVQDETGGIRWSRDKALNLYFGNFGFESWSVSLTSSLWFFLSPSK